MVPVTERSNDGEPAESCTKCKKTLRRDFTKYYCEKCKGAHHKGCTGVESEEALSKIKEDPEHCTFTCEKCQRVQEAILEKATPIVFDEELVEKSGGMSTETKGYLRVLQWNAEALAPKMFELKARLKEEDIDVCLIQETKLREYHTKPYIEGYKAYRADRITTTGGGLITFVKTSLIVEDLGECAQQATEVQTIRVRISKNKWVYITNVYVPPVNSKGQVIVLRTDIIPTNSSSLICGDFNGHSALWDYNLNPDKRGEALVDWALDEDLEIINNGDPTRSDRGENETLSTPDVTFCGRDWSGKTEWSVAEAIGSSDHLPIIININACVKHQQVFGSRSKWKDKGADWESYRKQLEESAPDIEQLELRSRIERFNQLMLDSAKAHVKKVKPGKKTRVYLTPAIRAKIKIRNNLRRNLKENKKEWKEACKEVNDSIREAKEESWKELVESAELDDRKIYGFIRQLSGTPANNSPNEVLVHKGKHLTSHETKANCFNKHYANVSSLKLSATERLTNRLCKKRLNQSTVNPRAGSDFNIRELEKALGKMKRKGAPGPDDIPPSFLKELGPLAKGVLLGIFNESFNESFCPQLWRSAIIVPLLKQGKPPGQVKSFRPVSLTSVVVKLFERMIAERIYHILENGNQLSNLQCGFRKGRSCEDAILKIVQAIENGFQRKQSERSVLVLLDYSSAFDTVWRQKLLLSLMDLGLPMQIVRWIACFLENRQARVRYAGATSRSENFKQGLPQGSVLSPLLFIIYINNLAAILPKSAIISMFADDVGILVTDRVAAKATKAAQKIVNVVVKWSREWRLTLNATKSEVAFFTKCKDGSYTPKIRIDGSEVPVVKNPRLLGVYLDRGLTFKYHAQKTSREAAEKLFIMSRVAHSTWGWAKKGVKRLYHMFIGSKMNYAASAWQPSLAPSNVKFLNTVQNRALRIINGQMQPSPQDSLNLEAGIPQYSTLINRTALKSLEKSYRVPEDHPLAETRTNAVKPRTGKNSWKRTTDRLAPLIPEEAKERKPFSWYITAPWSEPPEIEVHRTLSDISKKDPIEKQKEAAISQLDSHAADAVIYSDGSATAGTRLGGAGVVVTTGPASDLTVLHSFLVKGAAFTSSYEEEVRAAERAMDWILNQDQYSGKKIVLATDSQSLCCALESGNDDIQNLVSKICDINCRLVVQWVPGHCMLDGNELADAAAKQASKLDEPFAQTTFSAIKAHMVNLLPPDEPTHERSAKIYSCYRPSMDKFLKCRADQVEIARLRSGWHLGLGRTQNLFSGGEEPASCARCDHELDDLEHWMACPGTLEQRQRIFGRTEVGLSDLATDAQKCVALARRTMKRGAWTSVHH